MKIQIKCSINSADPDEMQHAAFHLGLHCLQKYPFIGGLQYTKG